MTASPGAPVVGSPVVGSPVVGSPVEPLVEVGSPEVSPLLAEEPPVVSDADPRSGPRHAVTARSAEVVEKVEKVEKVSRGARRVMAPPRESARASFQFDPPR